MAAQQQATALNQMKKLISFRIGMRLLIGLQIA